MNTFMPRLMLWTLLIIAALVAGWYVFEGSWDRRLFTAAPGQTCANLTGAQAHAWLSEHPETQVLDVRSAREFSGGAVPGAVNISLGDDHFRARVGELQRHMPVLLYCAGGYRSRKAVEVLKELGFTNIQHIHRGYLSWKSQSTQPRP